MVLVPVSFLLSQVSEEFHLSHAGVGAVEGSVFVGHLVGGLLLGMWADRWHPHVALQLVHGSCSVTDARFRYGRRPALIGATACAGLGATLFAVAPTFELLLLARVLAGFGCGGLGPVSCALLQESVPEAYQGALNVTRLIYHTST